MKRWMVFAILSVMVTGSVFGQEDSPQRVLARLFTVGADAVRYTEQFAQAISQTRLQAILDQISGQLGEFREVRGESNPYTAVFGEGTATVFVNLDERGRLAGIQFTQVVPAAGSLEEAVARFDELTGEVSYVVLENGRELAAHRAEEPQAVGSTFKLAVLRAVLHAIQAGALSWDQVVALQPRWKSLPSGILQDWPAGSSLTVETLAVLMVAHSDNTATDALIDLVGRKLVERYAPHSAPVLTTREAFVLKDPDNADLRDRYLEADPARRRELLGETASRDLPDESLFSGGPVSPEIEWFFTAGELCALMDEVAHLDLTTVNPGVASPDEWDRVSFKGGSEPGVLNLTVRLVTEEGISYCVSATQNRTDRDVDRAAFIAAFQGVIGALR